MNTWDKLSMRERADIMKLAIDNGIYNLDTIRGAYNEFAGGGSIHIKPSHRGRLTELKERTGKSEAELYNDGNPAHKKMVVFARNARKWKHGDGGPLVDRANYYDGLSDDNQQMTLKQDATYVAPIFRMPDVIEISPEASIRRSHRVYSNYDEAKDNPLSSFMTVGRNILRWAKDNIDDRIKSGVSNCTLTASQWVDPSNPIKNASSIVENPSKYNYLPVDSTEAAVGDILIAKNPQNDSYHTMLINGFSNDSGTYNFDGVNVPYNKNEPLLTYSRGGNDGRFIRRGVPLSVYTSNSDGKVENHFFRYVPTNKTLEVLKNKTK